MEIPYLGYTLVSPISGWLWTNGSSLWASVLLPAEWENANTSWPVSQSHCQSYLRSRWSTPIRCYLVNLYQGRKSQDIWARNKKWVPSKSLGITINCQFPRKGSERRDFAESEENAENQAIMYCGANLSQWPIPSTTSGFQPGPWHWASGQWHLHLLRLWEVLPFLSTEVHVSHNPSEGLS